MNYLGHILQVWSGIFGGSLGLMKRLDRFTVAQVERRAPGCSQRDASHLEELFRKRKLFPHIDNINDRRMIWENLQRVKVIVPSLFSFFEDVKYIRVPEKIMRKLFPRSRLTIRKAMYRIFTARLQKNNRYIVQESERSFRNQTGSSEDQFEFGYRQVWLATWRLCFDLIPECPRKEEGEDMPRPLESSPAKCYQLGELASRLGFESDEIFKNMNADPDIEIAQQVLYQARDRSMYYYEEDKFQEYVTEMSRMFKTAILKESESLKPRYVVDEKGQGLERRCGRVFNRAYHYDRKYLFLDNLERAELGTGADISSFFVRRSVYIAFFGNRAMHSTEPTSSSGQGYHGVSVQPPSKIAHPSIEPTQTGGGGLLPPEQLDPSGSAYRTSRVDLALPEQLGSVELILRPESSAVIHRTNSIDSVPPEPSGSVELIPRAASGHGTNGENSASVGRIFIYVVEGGSLRLERTSFEMDGDLVQRNMLKKQRNGFRIFDTSWKALTWKNCYDEVVRNGTNTIVLCKEQQINVTPMLIAETASLLQDNQQRTSEDNGFDRFKRIKR